MVEVLIWLAMGGVVGWMTSAIMQPSPPRSHGWNVCLGMAGAALGGWLIPPQLGMAAGSSDVLNMGALLVALVGAILLLAIAHLFQRPDDVAGPASRTAPDEH
ncbi:GlsB/YeaQ/YmgE family stress response membrane protein [Hydrogenophaga sp. BPS33]|uniref:GlsB/YeaQ/YmgE family stress response membrane protein n=1 Tax=Hydrogenophaga sp. BPS33 TaxID=2651974 RepID=UPI00131F8E77|nr:GlsB/YeaQ/YmgE family stress response membrane protein [Hydrogenophaga sp. BPS33]QHE85407.1 GlsB/YeaQ/YmgE family stress response membrane protein [Hydrogenophaga sp. BPS33]